MRVSNNWLKELVDIDLPADKIANDMLYVGNEYDAITEVCPATNLVVGRVVSKHPHPDSDHLNVCEVDLGDKIYQIVCGAPNVRENQKVIVSKVGAKLPGGEIKKSVIRGVESNGMICSLAELGLESKYVTEEDKKGIHVLPENAPVGVDAKEYLGFDDIYVDYELTANRSDLLNMLGVAYEVAAIYDKKVNIPEVDIKETKENTISYEEAKEIVPSSAKKVKKRTRGLGKKTILRNEINTSLKGLSVDELKLIQEFINKIKQNKELEDTVLEIYDNFLNMTPEQISDFEENIKNFKHDDIGRSK